MRSCCIIGGTGFIGSHVVRRLVSKREIIVIGKERIPSRPLPEGVLYCPGNYGNRKFLTGILKDVDDIISLAYSTVPKTSFEDPIRDILENLPASVALFEVASQLAIKKLVLVSSGGTVYGKTQDVPISETHPTNPISPYGITKLAIEKYAMMFNALKALPVVCVRPANAYGEGQKPFVGQGFIATAMASILRDKEISIFGESGTVRDYIYVTDVASGIVAALEHGQPGMYYNIGSGIGRSNREVLDAITPFARDAGFEVRLKILRARDFDVPVNVLDCTKLRDETGWELKVTFEEGIKRAWEWSYSAEHAKTSILKQKLKQA